MLMVCSSIFTPEKFFIYLLRANEMFKLFQPGKSPVLENFRRHVNSLEQIMELLRPASGIPGTLETREMLSDFFK